MKYTMHGITDEITTCDCCGKTSLKDTVALENEAGDVLYFGSHCAARVLGFGRGKARVIVGRARRMQKIRPIAEIVRAELCYGWEAALQAGKKAATGDVSVSGFESWGQINIDGPGVRISISF